MDEVVTIYQAKTHLSKLVKQAQAGKTIYIGAHGHPQAVLSPLPAKKKVNIGVWAHKAKPVDYKALEALDAEIAADFEASINRDLDL
jgi:prevent-host-death family protein